MEQNAFDSAFIELNNLQDQLSDFRRATRALKPADFNHESLQEAVDKAQNGDTEAISSPIFLYSGLLGGMERMKDYIETMADILNELEIVERIENA